MSWKSWKSRRAARKRRYGRDLVPGEYLWSVATGTPDPFVKASREACDFIAARDGFVGVHLMAPRGALWLFGSENDAKAARNLMKGVGIICGRNIARFKVAADGVPVYDDPRAGDGDARG